MKPITSETVGDEKLNWILIHLFSVSALSPSEFCPFVFSL